MTGTTDGVDDLLWGLLILAFGGAVVVYVNDPSAGRALVVMLSVVCGLLLTGRAIHRRRR